MLWDFCYVLLNILFTFFRVLHCIVLFYFISDNFLFFKFFFCLRLDAGSCWLTIFQNYTACP